MLLQLQNFNTLVQTMAATVQSAATQLLDLTVGSTLRAVLEASASIGLWMQWLILQVLQTTRAATSVGSDLDSWMADFSLVRLPASASVGSVLFSRFTPTQAALVPVGTLVRTADGTQSFVVSAVPTNPAWSAAQNGYVIAAGVASVSVPVVAVVAGAAGNVQAGVVTLLGSAIPGVDTVTNAAPFQGGLDAESDPAFRARFQAYINSRSLATPSAVGYAIASVQQGLDYTIQENVSPAGLSTMGNFVVTVDDGSGSPSTTLLAAVTGAIDAVRPVGTTYAVQPPGVLTANISLGITAAANSQLAVLVGTVGAAITSYVDALKLGQSLPLSRIVQLAYDADPGVSNVSGVTINGGTSDLLASPAQLVKAGTVAVG